MARGDPEINADTPGAIYDPGHLSGRGEMAGAGWRMPTEYEIAQKSYDTAYAALSPGLRAMVESGQLEVDPIITTAGPGHDRFSTASGIKGFTSYGPNNTVNFYDTNGQLIRTASRDSGGGFGFFSDLVGAVSNAISSVGSAVESAVNSVGKTVEAIIQNPLPVIETVALVAVGVPPPVASAAVTAMNGGDITAVVAAAAGAYVGGQVASGVSGELTAAQPTAGAYLPSTTDSLLVKVGASAAGADAAATTAALVSGKSFNDALAVGANAVVRSLAGSAGSAAGAEVASNIEDPTLAKIAGAATKGGTTAALTGKDIGAGASKSAQGDVLNAVGDVIGSNLPSLPSGPNIDLSGLKAAIKPISDVVTSTVQPISDVATTALQPLEKPIKEAAQGISDTATKVLQPFEEPIKSAAQKTSDVVTSVGDVIKNIPADNLDKSIINLMGQAPTAETLGQPAVSNVAAGGEGSAASGGSSAAAYGGADVAMLGDTSVSGLGSKVSKKGGKYPWGEPEGTTALKEGLGV